MSQYNTSAGIGRTWAALARARRGRTRRPSAYRPAGLEPCEARALLTTLVPAALAEPYVVVAPITNNNITNHPQDGLVNDICVNVSLDPKFFQRFGQDAAADVGMATYLAYGGKPFDLRDQVLLDSATTELSANHSTAELCAAVDDEYCIQFDIFTGDVVSQFTTSGRTFGSSDYGPRLILGGFVEEGGHTVVNYGPPGTPGFQDQFLADCPPKQGGQGLSPGYWKNHAKAWASTGLTQTMTLHQVFGDAVDAYGLGGYTLQQALEFHGGPTVADKAQILLRQAVASLLNAESDQVSFDLSGTQVILKTQHALASGDPSQILALANQFDTLNNQGVPGH